MSKKKSLGSSPIGYSTNTNSQMGFIPDLGVSTSKSSVSTKNEPKTEKSVSTAKNSNPSKPTEDKKVKSKEKKIVSYNLEVDLVSKIKDIAKQQEIYYSTLVNQVLKSWLSENN